MTDQEQVIRAIGDGSLSRHEISEILGYSELRTFGLLKRMREAGDIALTGDGRYERAHGGYLPGGAA